MRQVIGVALEVAGVGLIAAALALEVAPVVGAVVAGVYLVAVAQVVGGRR